MFARIGVAVDFRFRPRSCPQGALQIRFTTETPRHFIPGALAYALPYEGVHIPVFYDRIRDAVPPPVVPYLLAHVLVHEIAHILEGAQPAFSERCDEGALGWRPIMPVPQRPLQFTVRRQVHLIQSRINGSSNIGGWGENAEGAAVTAR